MKERLLLAGTFTILLYLCLHIGKAPKNSTATEQSVDYLTLKLSPFHKNCGNSKSLGCKAVNLLGDFDRTLF
jgi:hypothetical protein